MTQVEASFGGEFEQTKKENAEIRKRLLFQDKERQVGIIVGGWNEATTSIKKVMGRVMTWCSRNEPRLVK